MGERQLNCGGRRLDLGAPATMGVLNVTPDSFSDGGEFVEPKAAIEHAQAMEAEGATLIDVGGESTRPGAEPVPVERELRRVIPVIEALAPRLSVPLSVDTSKPEVMTAAARAGVGLINDVNGFRAEGAVEAAAATGLPLCIMHMQGEPRTMQAAPRYDDVVEDVIESLAGRIAACESAGIPRQRLVIDPGFGFGKTMAHNARLLRELGTFRRFGLPILVGLSRKSFIGNIINRPAGERQAGSVAAAVLAVCQGASIVRAHDVAATVDALAVAHYVNGSLAD